jgi:hypothetical protein
MDSLLTKFLMDSLTGNSLTSVLITVSKHRAFVDESLSSLNFGHVACQVKTKVIFSVELSKEELEKQLHEARA